MRPVEKGLFQFLRVMSGFCGNVQRPPSALKQQGLCFHTHFQPCAPPLAILSYSFSIYNVDVKPSLCVSNTASLSLRWKMAWMVIGFYIKIEAVEDFDFTAKQNLHTAKFKKNKRHLSPISKSAIWKITPGDLWKIGLPFQVSKLPGVVDVQFSSHKMSQAAQRKKLIVIQHGGR